MGNIILVTGATSGFGKAIAERFAAQGWDCIITGRRKEKLMAFAGTLQSQFGVKVLPLDFDVQSRQQVEAKLTQLPPKWQRIRLLVNNAGLLNPLN